MPILVKAKYNIIYKILQYEFLMLLFFSSTAVILQLAGGAVVV